MKINYFKDRNRRHELPYIEVSVAGDQKMESVFEVFEI